MPRQFAVIGLGNFGAQLAAELTRRGAEVLAIDEREADPAPTTAQESVA